MAQCAVCKSEIAVHARRCRRCGAGVKLLADAPSNKQLSRARMCHLLALPEMLILATYPLWPEGFSFWALLPLNLVIPFLYWLLHLKSRFVRSHGAQAFNFQLLWTPAMYAVWIISPDVGQVTFGLVWMLALAVVVAGGVALVWIASNDAASAGDGKYPIRIPLFR